MDLTKEYRSGRNPVLLTQTVVERLEHAAAHLARAPGLQQAEPSSTALDMSEFREGEEEAKASVPEADAPDVPLPPDELDDEPAHVRHYVMRLREQLITTQRALLAARTDLEQYEKELTSQRWRNVMQHGPAGAPSSARAVRVSSMVAGDVSMRGPQTRLEDFNQPTGASQTASMLQHAQTLAGASSGGASLSAHSTHVAGATRPVVDLSTAAADARGSGASSSYDATSGSILDKLAARQRSAAAGTPAGSARAGAPAPFIMSTPSRIASIFRTPSGGAN